MNQTKNNVEASRNENKRERRRGAAGRAAVLRRAPSDSDCSGETASLSADSGERVVRPAPPPPRSTKSRRLHISVNSRRRGSEWEVLEGLKDGQRFEKRPDVFNGYLHKKRKWPLKGWHKRFFVVDGGILVYARSPADVARGRLHGSVDVGLSVISAKARRRRIDIDADEFIYHLRAKTPELFRTWLNVLKAHRLYRQHLLTFGARESAPKIHAPPDDLPATDTSSRTSVTTSETSTVTSTGDHPSPDLSNPFPIYDDSSIYCHKDENSLYSWQQKCSKSNITLNNESPGEKMFDLKIDDAVFKNRSLCSMNCMARTLMNLKRMQSPDFSLNSTDAENQMICTDLTSLKSTDPRIETSFLEKLALLSKKNNIPEPKDVDNHKRSLFSNAKVPITTACYFFTRKKNRIDTVSVMKKSKKCTNLVKYKNMFDEPPLKMPTSKCMLLGKYKLKPILSSKQLDTMKPQNRAVGCETILNENSETQAQIEVIKENKASQNAMTSTEYDKITEKLLVSIFQKQTDGADSSDIKHYIDRVVKDLYDVKVDQEMHPVKALFRCLLEYWMKNTSIPQFKEAMTSAKLIERQSNRYFTKDKKISSVFVHMLSKETQLHALSDLVKYKTNKNNTARARQEKKNSPKCLSPRRDTESYEKERRIQELERLLKNTVYICETQRNNQCREKDIKITKKLIDNLGKLSKKSNIDNGDKPNLEKSVSSTELPEIQDTINHLISETAIPPDFAKEFLGAYLDVLLHDGSKSTTTSQSSVWSAQSRDLPVCQVQAEPVVKKVSRSVTAQKIPDKISHDKRKSFENEKQVDPGQVYLKDVLDKITTIFTKVNKTVDTDSSFEHSRIETKRIQNSVGNAAKYELGRPVKICPQNNFIHENSDGKSLVIDLSKYNLEHIAMFNDPVIKGAMSISIKLKEKPPNSGESKQTHLNLKFAEDAKPIVTPVDKSENWMSFINNESESDDIFNRVHKVNKPCLDFVADRLIDLKPYLSTSDATSKAYRFLHESSHSVDASLKSSDSIKNVPVDLKEIDYPKPCYIMSFRKGSLATKFQSKKKVKLKDGMVVSTPTDESPCSSPVSKRRKELTVFEKPTPRIIDEKFILLLLENLMLLSKNVPTLFKDINSLYLKLRKKHEKVVKNCSNIQGLSLLGKIYNDESYVNGSNDKTTQFSTKGTEIDNPSKENKNCSTNTIKNVTDKEVSTTTEREPVKAEIQTKEEDDKILKVKLLKPENVQINTDEPTTSTSMNDNVNDRMTVTQTETVDIDSLEHATSIPNWFSKICTKDCAASTIIKYIFDNESTHNFRMTPAKQIIIEREQLKKKRCSPKMRQDLIKEISLLSPSFKVSTQSQTDKQRLKLDKLERDFNVYQLFLSPKYGLQGSSSMTVVSADVRKSDDMKTLYRCSSDPSYASGLISPTSPPLRGPQAGFVSGTPGGRLADWIIESGGPLDNATRELGQAQLSVQQLQRLLDALELQQQVHHDTDVSLEGASPNVKKDRRKFGLRKKKSNSKCASVELAPPHIDPSSSHTALSALTAPPSPGGGASSIPNSAASLPIACAAARPQSLPGADSLATSQTGPASLTSLTPDHQLREDFAVLAKDLVASLKGVVATLVCERSRLRAAMEAAESPAIAANPSVAALRTNLSSALQQNSELRSRLSRIHDASDIAEILSNSDLQSPRQFQQSLSYSSSCVSASEFFDAEEHEDDDDLKPEVAIDGDEGGVIELDGDSSSEAGSLSSGEEGSASSDNSDGAMLSAEAVTLRHDTASPGAAWRRRTRLPAPRPAPGGPSLWNLLYKNIGKDLSQISMPVTINEPLNMLQRLCEELEYSELLDSAAECSNSVERMALVAAFAVSAYAASAHRAASKPFNPLLGETYECVRDDRGFRFLAEQVSHHPPISACHAESPRWCFWQEARIKTKFWGKSMEFQPTGRVHVRLTTTGDHYTWNKVTTCVHNLFGGQRWVDQYGDMHIVCVGTDISAKLNFIKASSWSHTRHEVRGCISGRGARLRLAGRWSEALHAGEPPAARCLWRPGAMPPEHELYYGFTRFAMELNEMEPGMPQSLPHTDTRLRPDQRALEEGLVDAAEQLKHELEQAQRERRRDSTHHAPAWFRKVTEEGEETWVFSNEYWKAREAGFGDAAPAIW